MQHCKWHISASASWTAAAKHTANRARLRGPKKVSEQPRSARAVSPRTGRAGRTAGDEGNASFVAVHSPREDRAGQSPGAHRSGSQGDLSHDISRRPAPSGRDADEGGTIRAVRRELDEVRHENSRLQDKLCKARSLVVLLQRQADEARAERDREHKRADSLQLTVQQLQRQLKREAAKTHHLERSLSVTGKLDTTGAVQGKGEEESLTNAVGNGVDNASNQLDDPNNFSVEEPFEEVKQGEDSGIWEPTLDPDKDSPEGDGPPKEAALDTASTTASASQVSTERSWEFFVQGQHDQMEQMDFSHKLVSCFPDDAVERAWSRGVACVCSRGRRLDNAVPNQDDFLIARHTLAHDGHIALYGVFDGHGPAGHHCAAFARGSLPESLFGQHTLLMKPEDTLRQAFQQTQTNMLQQPFDTETSGTTAALALVLNIPGAPVDQDGQGGYYPHDQPEARQSETWLFVAHVGDSRVILASHREEEPTSFSVTALTRDHRPDDAEEAERIRRHGGEIRKLHRNSGAVRVFARDQDRPGLALTRTLGAVSAADCGVSPEPEISAYRLRPGIDVLLMLGTDGLFEFCDNTEAAGKLLKNGVSVSVLEEICAESRQQWAQSSYNETVDDITAIAVSLPSNMGSSVTRSTEAAGQPCGQLA